MVPVLVAFGLTFALCPVVLSGLRRWEVLDVPGARSSHARPVPRGGGLAPAVGASVALALAPSVPAQLRAGLLAGAGLFAVIGFLEDVVGIPALRRLALQVVAAVVMVPFLAWSLDGRGAPGPVLVAAALAAAALWLVAYVNAFNFMDGINGISVAQVVVAGATWYVVGRVEDVPGLLVPASIAVGAALAFAPFNFPGARMFLGDVGSYFLGAWLAALALYALGTGISPEAVLAPLSVYLVDTGTTLIRRFRRRETLHLPHRDHTYQRLVRLGWSHTRTTLFVAAVMAVTSALGGLALTESLALRVAGDVLIALCLVGYLTAPRLLRRGTTATVVALTPS